MFDGPSAPLPFHTGFRNSKRPPFVRNDFIFLLKSSGMRLSQGIKMVWASCSFIYLQSNLSQFWSHREIALHTRKFSQLSQLRGWVCTFKRAIPSACTVEFDTNKCKARGLIVVSCKLIAKVCTETFHYMPDPLNKKKINCTTIVISVAIVALVTWVRDLFTQLYCWLVSWLVGWF